MTTKENAAQAGQQGGKGDAEQLNYSLFIEQVTVSVKHHNRSGGYPFTSAMELAQQHGINKDNATTAMRQAGRFCLDVDTRNLHLLRSAKL